MGNFEKLSVLVIVVIIVMILVVALYTWTDSPADTTAASNTTPTSESPFVPPAEDSARKPSPPPLDWPLPDEAKPKEKARSTVGVMDGPATLPPPPTPPPPAPEPKAEETPKPPPAPAPTERFHVVKEGETLGAIAKAELGSASKWTDIQKANPGLEPERLREGMKVRIPGAAAAADAPKELAKGGGDAAPAGPAKAGASYTVRRGETLEKISKKVYGTSSRWPEIWVHNLARLDSPDDVMEGMILQMPK